MAYYRQHEGDKIKLVIEPEDLGPDQTPDAFAARFQREHPDDQIDFYEFKDVDPVKPMPK